MITRCWGQGTTGSNLSVGMAFSFGVMKMFWNELDVVVAMQAGSV